MFKKNKPIFAAVVAAIIFGFSFLFTKDALDHMETFQLMGLRFLIAALVLTMLKILGIIKVEIHSIKLKGILILAIFQPVLYFICETFGVGLTSASESGIMISLVPISATLFAVSILKEQLSLSGWFGVFVSVAGVLMIVLAKGSHGGSKNLLGFLFLFGAVLSAGVYNVFSRKISKTVTPIEITYIMMWTGAVVFNSIGLFRSILRGEIHIYFIVLTDMSVLFNILYLGILSSILAFFLLNYALSKMEASRTVMFMNLTPVVSVLAGVFIRNEEFYPLQMVGAAIVLMGLIGLNYFTKNQQPTKVCLQSEDA